VNFKEGALDYESLIRQKLARGESLEDEKKKPDDDFKTFAWEWFEIYAKNNNKHSEILSKETTLRVHLVPFFGKIKIGKIDSLKVEEYKRLKAKSNLCNKTINNHLAILRKSLSTAEEWELLDRIPKVRLLKVQPQKYDFLSEIDCKTLLGSPNGIIGDMILIALRTGLRFGEIIALEWQDIDLDRRMLSVNKSIAQGVLGSPKSNRARHIPLSSDVFEMLGGRYQKIGFVFAGGDGKPLRQSFCGTVLHRICREAGLRKIGWHTLRHTFASTLVKKGISLKAVQELLGHSDIRMTMRYAHLSQSELRSAIDVLDPQNDFGQQMGNTRQFRVAVTNQSEMDKVDYLALQKQKVDTEVPTFCD
jgi:integrase